MTERLQPMKPFARIILVSSLALAAGCVDVGKLNYKSSAAAIVVAVLGFAALAVMTKDNRRVSFEPQDDDAGFDEEDEEESMPDPQIEDGWAIFVADTPVFEAKEIAEKLESAGLRPRLEITHEDKSFNRHGNFGMGTRMRILVPPSEYERAKETVDPSL